MSWYLGFSAKAIVKPQFRDIVARNFEGAENSDDEILSAYFKLKPAIRNLYKNSFNEKTGVWEVEMFSNSRLAGFTNLFEQVLFAHIIQELLEYHLLDDCYPVSPASPEKVQEIDLYLKGKDEEALDILAEFQREYGEDGRKYWLIKGYSDILESGQ